MKTCTHCGKPYGDDVTVCPDDGAAVGTPGAAGSGPPVVSGERSSTLAVTSLILGILSIALCLGPLLGIPAVICGHIAWNRSRNHARQFGGGRMSVAGLITGYIGIVVFLIGAGLLLLILPALAKAREKAGQITCGFRIQRVEMAMHSYATSHNGMLPTNLMDLTNELSDPNLLICPADHHHHRSGSRAMPVWDPENVSYLLATPGVAESAVQPLAVIRCPIHGTEVLGNGTLKMTNSSSRISFRKGMNSVNATNASP